MAIIELKKPIASQPGINRRAKAEPNVPGALGARPEPNPTPQNAMILFDQDIALKFMTGLCKVLISMKLNRAIYAIL